LTPYSVRHPFMAALRKTSPIASARLLFSGGWSSFPPSFLRTPLVLAPRHDDLPPPCKAVEVLFLLDFLAFQCDPLLPVGLPHFFFFRRSQPFLPSCDGGKAMRSCARPRFWSLKTKGLSFISPLFRNWLGFGSVHCDPSFGVKRVRLIGFSEFLFGSRAFCPRGSPVKVRCTNVAPFRCSPPRDLCPF